MENKQKQIGDYVIMAEVLGYGAYATCQKAYFYNDPSVITAVKIISKIKLKEERFPDQHIERIRSEINTQKLLKNENIVKIVDIQQSPNNIYVFLEYCNGGNLAEFLSSRNGILAESEVIMIFNSLKFAFEEMHKHNCMHRDLKPQNILLHNGQIKLADFGFAKIVEDMNKSEAQTLLGTPKYLPIEILEFSPYSAKCDIFSLGIIIYELLFGFHPFYSNESMLNKISFPAMAEKLKLSKLQFPSNIVVNNKALLDLLSKMLQIKEENRISWKEFFQHQFFVEQIKKDELLQLKIENTKDSLEKSLLQTNKYLENNLVQGKISLISKIKDWKKSNSETPSNIIKQDQSKEQSISIQNDLKKKADELHSYLIFERNIAIFFSDLLRQFFSLISSSALTIPREQLYKLLFLFNKFSIIFLQKVKNKLNQDNSFQGINDQLLWKYYKTLPLFDQTQELIQIDLANLNELFKNLLPKVQQILIQANDQCLNVYYYQANLQTLLGLQQ